MMTICSKDFAPNVVYLTLLLLTCIYLSTASFNDRHSDKIMLSDVKALTLHQGQMTNARRSPAVPQLKCVGGSAQHKFQPKVVQCMNRGSDGYDIQWECKTDMDNAYRFGHVEVTCEGYDYPNDPFVLKGSCGLEYTIEFTEDGLSREKQGGSYSYNSQYNYKQSEGGLGGLLFFLGIMFAIYMVYKKCLAQDVQTGPTRADTQPPPYGFRPEFTSEPPPTYESTQNSRFTSPNSGYTNPGYSCGSGTGTGANASPMGGFWTGAATGGLMGYLFGQNRNSYGGQGWRNTHHHHNQHSSGSFFSSSHSPPSSSGSSGTRTSSGFGGTSRR